MATQNIEQRSLDWFRSRLGNFSGSEVGDLMQKGRTKDQLFGNTALSYIYKVAVERNLNPKIVEDDFWFQNYLDQNTVSSKAMQWGVDNEEPARRLCEKVWKVKIEEVPSVNHSTIEHFSASPDGYICEGEDRGVVEIKCVGISNFGKYLFKLKDAGTLKEINPTYYWQVMAEMACTGAKYCIFFVYCPFVKKPYVSVKIERDEEAIGQLEERVKLANEYINENINL